MRTATHVAPALSPYTLDAQRIHSRTTAAAWQFSLLTGSATAMELMVLAQTLPMILCEVFHKEYSYHEYTIAGIPGDSL
jgi:hypothetical protein